MKPRTLIQILFFSLLIGCTGIDLIDDYVPPVVRITTPVTSLTVGTNFQFEARYFNVIGELTPGFELRWESSDPNLLEIDAQGNVTPKKEGTVTITVRVTSEEGKELSDQINFEIKSAFVLIPEDMDPEEEVEMLPEMNTSSSTLVMTVTPTLQISNGIAQITVGTEYLFEIQFTDELGMETQPETVLWESSNSEVLSVDENGTLTAVSAGTASVTVSTLVSDTLILYTNSIQVVNPVMVSTVTSYTGIVETTSSYQLEGTFTLAVVGEQLILSVGSDYKASTALPGLYIYLSNNNNTISQALELGAVTVFQGAHEYILPSHVELMDYQYILYWCKPFNVKVGHAKIYD